MADTTSDWTDRGGILWKDRARALQLRIRNRFRVAVDRHRQWKVESDYTAAIGRWVIRLWRDSSVAERSSIKFYKKRVGKDFDADNDSIIVHFLQSLAVPVIGNACHAFMHGLNHIQGDLGISFHGCVLLVLDLFIKAILYFEPEQFLATVLPRVPDVEGLKKDRCQLTRTPNAYRFANKELNSYFEFLFELIVERAPSMGINVSLNRYDFFHGHLFLASDTGRLGVLFHAREYPAYEKERFPYNLGFCQKGSNVIYDDSMNLRNILWLAPLPSNSTKAWLAPGILVVLDAHPDGIIYQKLAPEYVDVMRTIYEDDFGVLVADVNYLNLGNAAPGEKIFIC